METPFGNACRVQDLPRQAAASLRAVEYFQSGQNQAEKARYLRLVLAGRRCIAASRFLFSKEKTLYNDEPGNGKGAHRTG